MLNCRFRLELLDFLDISDAPSVLKHLFHTFHRVPFCQHLSSEFRGSEGVALRREIVQNPFQNDSKYLLPSIILNDSDTILKDFECHFVKFLRVAHLIILNPRFHSPIFFHCPINNQKNDKKL